MVVLKYTFLNRPTNDALVPLEPSRQLSHPSHPSRPFPPFPPSAPSLVPRVHVLFLVQQLLDYLSTYQGMHLALLAMILVVLLNIASKL